MPTWVRIVVVLVALLVSAWGGAVVVSQLLRRLSRPAATEEPGAGSPGGRGQRGQGPGTGSGSGDGPAPRLEGPDSAAATSALRGGTAIGVLERLATTGAVLAGFPAAIAFVIAVKGLGRYPELKDNPDASERFVIGTLASLIWAAAAGLAAVALLG